MNYTIRKEKTMWYLEWENGKISRHSTKKGAEITALFVNSNKK